MSEIKEGIYTEYTRNIVIWDIEKKKNDKIFGDFYIISEYKNGVKNGTEIIYQRDYEYDGKDDNYDDLKDSIECVYREFNETRSRGTFIKKYLFFSVVNFVNGEKDGLYIECQNDVFDGCCLVYKNGLVLGIRDPALYPEYEGYFQNIENNFDKFSHLRDREKLPQDPIHH